MENGINFDILIFSSS